MMLLGEHLLLDPFPHTVRLGLGHRRWCHQCLSHGSEAGRIKQPGAARSLLLLSESSWQMAF